MAGSSPAMTVKFVIRPDRTALWGESSVGGRFRGVVHVADMLEPRRALAVVAALRHREMGEQAIRRGAVPMPGVGRNDPGVAGIEDLRRLALQAETADPPET